MLDQIMSFQEMAMSGKVSSNQDRSSQVRQDQVMSRQMQVMSDQDRSYHFGWC